MVTDTAPFIVVPPKILPGDGDCELAGRSRHLFGLNNSMIVLNFDECSRLQRLSITK